MSSDIISRYFKKGAEIEISSDDVGFRGSWYAGTVVRPPQNDKSKKVLVEYKTLMKSESTSQRLREEVGLVQLRPAPPPEKRLKFKFSEEVDAWYNDGWWEGIVTELLGDDKYAVFFRSTKEQLHFRARELRLHREWVYGKWVPPLGQANDDEPPRCNQMQNDSMPAENFEHNFSPGTLIEVCSNDEGFEGAWFTATVVKDLNNEKYLIEYQNIYDDKEDTKLLREEVDSRQLRPYPPDIGIVDRFEVREQVDALYDGVWWVGVISKVRKNDKYSVWFKDADEILSFEHSDLRVHQEWINGKWVIPPKVLEL
ncbi:protein AGENET DOMAIN (AGD)-CONTAINING P1-like isoform X1 [Primulina huaijiensis]|uniref:protein AGENET DOMAIN (AGD)-CONTAINING P1-like isoform X1 n=1 Tax=Primulina huaijiensis TaxID=1492673 RepID=UPI003CC7215A